MRHYFITGGTGLVGRALVRELLTRPDTHKLTLLTRNAQRHWGMLAWSPKIQFVEGDVVNGRFPDFGYTDIIHAAAEANDLLQPDLHGYYYILVEGTVQMMKFCQQAVPERILYVSSGAVGKSEESVYCRGKRMAELAVDRYCPWAKIARPFALIGEEIPIGGQYAIGKFVRDAMYEGEVRYYSNGSVRSYAHVTDAARMMLDILDSGNENQPYDVGSVHPVPVDALARLVAEEWGVPLIQIPPNDPHETSLTYIPDPARMYTLHETITLRESIQRIRKHLCPALQEER